MSAEASFYVKGIIWDPPVGDHLPTTLNGDAISILPIDDFQSISDARASLEEVDDERWDWGSWFHHAISSGSPTIGVRDPETSKIVGFCSIERDAFVVGSPFPGIVDLNLEITSVYVRPDYRGKGFATTLRNAATAYLRSIIDSIASIPTQDIADLGLEGLSVTVSSFPESQEGHAFANFLSGEVERHLAAISGTAWFGQAVFIDETDPEETPSPA
ncbi:Acetyltransferase (GNAT) family protein [compost metagenome]